MFRGRFEHTIDAKGRLSIPAKFREVLGGEYDSRLIVTTNDGCLVAYPYKEWLVLEEKLASLPRMKNKTMNVLRHFYSGATDFTIDKLGRILVPQALREYAGLNKDVVLIGLMQQFEIWDKDAFAAREADEAKGLISGTFEDFDL